MSIIPVALGIAFFGFLIYWKWDDTRKWETVYEGNLNDITSAHGKVSALEAKGIRCNMKTLSPLYMQQHQNPSAMTTVRVLVKKKDADKAHQILAEYQRNLY